MKDTAELEQVLVWQMAENTNVPDWAVLLTCASVTVWLAALVITGELPMVEQPTV